MKYCTNCGSPLKDGDSVCPGCGVQLQSVTHRERKKRPLLITILLWLFFWPILFPLWIVKQVFVKRPKNLYVLAGIIVLAAGISQFRQTDLPRSSELPTEAESGARSDELEFSGMTDAKLQEDFLAACSQIGMDPKKIKDFQQVDDWSGGPRFSFVYQGISFRLYCNADSTVSSIRLGTDTDLYKQGYEPYQVTDYLVDPSVEVQLEELAQETVTEHLKEPDEASFSWLDWSCSRDHDLYSVSGSVSAENGFGAKEQLPFACTYHMENETFRLVDLLIDGTVILDDWASVSIPERGQVQTETTADATEGKTISLIDGIPGNYGEEVEVDGSHVILYHVPEGQYTVTNDGGWCKVYVAKDAYSKNSDGFMENEIVNTVEFSKYGETDSLSVASGEHIELTIHARVKLTPES